MNWFKKLFKKKSKQPNGSYSASKSCHFCKEITWWKSSSRIQVRKWCCDECKKWNYLNHKNTSKYAYCFRCDEDTWHRLLDTSTETRIQCRKCFYTSRKEPEIYV